MLQATPIQPRPPMDLVDILGHSSNPHSRVACTPLFLPRGLKECDLADQAHESA